MQTDCSLSFGSLDFVGNTQHIHNTYTTHTNRFGSSNTIQSTTFEYPGEKSLMSSYRVNGKGAREYASASQQLLIQTFLQTFLHSYSRVPGTDIKLLPSSVSKQGVAYRTLKVEGFAAIMTAGRVNSMLEKVSRTTERSRSAKTPSLPTTLSTLHSPL